MVTDFINYFCCPDCHTTDRNVRLKQVNGQVVCSKCRRIFLTRDNYIDLLPIKPSTIPKKTHVKFSDYYYEQFKTDPKSVYNEPSAWGEFSKLPRGYQIFLKEEQKIISDNYPKGNNTFCDLSGSQGFFGFIASRYFKTVFFCDINLEYLQHAQRVANKNNIKNIVFIRSDYLNLPFINSTIDAVLSTDSLIYYGMKSDMKVIGSVYKKLKKGGRFIFDLHSKKIYAPAKRIYEYSWSDIKKITKKYKNMKVYMLGRVPTILHPYRTLFYFFSHFRFLPALRYVCILEKR